MAVSAASFLSSLWITSPAHCSLYVLYIDTNYRYISALVRPDAGTTCLGASTQYLRGQMKHRRCAHFNGPISSCNNILLDFQTNTFYFYHVGGCIREQLPESNYKSASLLSFNFLLKIYFACDVSQELTTLKC